MVRGRDRELAPLVQFFGDLLELGLDGCDAVGAQLQPGGRVGGGRDRHDCRRALDRVVELGVVAVGGLVPDLSGGGGVVLDYLTGGVQ